MRSPMCSINIKSSFREYKKEAVLNFYLHISKNFTNIVSKKFHEKGGCVGINLTSSYLN